MIEDKCPACDGLYFLSVIEETQTLPVKDWEYVCAGCGAEGTLEEMKKS